MKIARMALRIFTITVTYYLPYLLILSLFTQVDARLYSSHTNGYSRPQQESASIGDVEDFLTIEKRLPISMSWNGPTMDDLYAILSKSGGSRIVGSRVPRGGFQTMDNSDYHPERWPIMPAFVTGFRDRAHDSITG